MYLMYVDESGDTGFLPGATSYFALSGIVIHESRWRDFVTAMKAFRQSLRTAYGLPVRVEIHAYDFMRSPPIPKMPPHIRVAILRNLLDELAQFPDISITNVVVKKAGKAATYDVFGSAWKVLFQRFENTLKNGNFPGAHRGDHGLVFTDATNGMALSSLMRKMAVHNPIPHQQWAGPGYRLLPVSRVIEDPHGVDSKRSYFIQAADVCAYFLLQRYAPNGRTRRHGATRYFDRLRPVLNLKASRMNALGIVEL
jgi:Protein of unknown function (DUF3800)